MQTNNSLLSQKMAEVGPASRLVCFLKVIIQGVWINRFQLFLTTFTMAIGSLGLALTIFLGDGALGVLWADIDTLLGSWTLIAPDIGEEGRLLERRLVPYFTEEDFEQLRKDLPMARMVTPAVLEMPVQVRSARKELRIHMDAVTKEFGAEEIFRPVEGRGLSSEAYQGLVKECLVTVRMLTEFGIDLEKNPSILINGHLFNVVGVTHPPPLNRDRYPMRVTVPYTFARTLWMNPGDIGIIIVAWHDVSDMEIILDKIRKNLDQWRGPGTYYLSSKQFQIQSGKKIINTFIAVGTTQSIFCIVIASIGVLNVMLTNVARRTHEFAIRIAMGARQRDILMVVLAESICIGLLGAVVGLLLAVASAPFIGDIMASSIEEAAKLQPEISLKGIVQPLLICGLCSLAAGVIPALKVRNVDILEALRKNV